MIDRGEPLDMSIFIQCLEISDGFDFPRSVLSN